MSYPTGPSLLSRLSDEYLVLICEELLPSHRDLYSVCLASKRLYGCGIRALYRSVGYGTQTAYTTNLQHFWCDGPGQTMRMKSAPQSVAFSGLWCDDWKSGNPWMPLPDEQVWDNLGNTWEGSFHEVRENLEHPNACTTLFAHLLSFISLKTLSFENCHLPDKESLALILQGMPRLRNLVIKDCVFMEQPLPESITYGVSTNLPLTSLTLVKNRVSRHRVMGAGLDPRWLRAGSPLPFALAPSLTCLEITWDDALLEMYMLDSNMGTERIGVSPLLERLTSTLR